MPEVERWAGAGPGLTPAGDDVLAGYIAALVLYRGERGTAAATAERAAARTGSLAATLLRHAARGELPEPAHRLLDDSDPAPLLAFGHSSGPCLMLGLALGVTHAGEEVAPAPRWGSGVELRVTTRRSGDAIVVGHAWI
jgi:hypothetical protein